MSEALHQRIRDHLDLANLVKVIDDSFDDHDVVDLAQSSGIPVDSASRDDLIARLADKVRADESARLLLARALLRVNHDVIEHLQSMEASDVLRVVLDGESEWSRHRGRMICALLADTRQEVNAMLERLFERQPSSHGESEAKIPEHESQRADWISEELVKELEQARQERAELMKLLREVRGVLVQLNAKGSSDGMVVEQKPQAEGRVGLFVDVQHIFYNARNYYGRKLDFKRLIEVTTKDRAFVTAVAYLVLSPEVDQTNFITMLEQNGYAVREKLPRRRGDSLTLSDEELPMALDVLKRVQGLDVAVLAGGDVDILSLAQRIQSAGTKVELYGFPQNTAEEILRAVDRFYPIDDALLLPQDYTPKRLPHDGQHRGGPANRPGLTRGYLSQQRRGWGTDPRGTT